MKPTTRATDMARQRRGSGWNDSSAISASGFWSDLVTRASSGFGGTISLTGPERSSSGLTGCALSQPGCPAQQERAAPPDRTVPAGRTAPFRGRPRQEVGRQRGRGRHPRHACSDGGQHGGALHRTDSTAAGADGHPIGGGVLCQIAVRGLPAEQDDDDGEHRGTGEVQQTGRTLPCSGHGPRVPLHRPGLDTLECVHPDGPCRTVEDGGWRLSWVHHVSGNRLCTALGRVPPVELLVLTAMRSRHSDGRRQLPDGQTFCWSKRWRCPTLQDTVSAPSPIASNRTTAFDSSARGQLRSGSIGMPERAKLVHA